MSPKPGTVQRVFIDRGLDTLDRWMRDQLERVARRLQPTEEEVERRNDGMERWHINRDTVITRRQ